VSPPGLELRVLAADGRITAVRGGPGRAALPSVQQRDGQCGGWRWRYANPRYPALRRRNKQTGASASRSGTDEGVLPGSGPF